MAYCALADVQALNPKRDYGESTEPTSTQVETLIDQIAVELDAALEAKGFTVPITAPANFVNYLKALNAYGAGALAEAGMFPETTEKGSTPHWKVLEDKYQAGLKALRDNETPWLVLPSIANVASNYTVDTDQDNYPEPAFRMSSSDREF